MKKTMLIGSVLGLVIASSGASAAFTCEQIKEKATRSACIADRVEKEKAASAEKEKAVAERVEKAKAESADKEKASAEAEKTKELAEFVSKSKDALIKDFKDPFSARLSNLVVSERASQRTFCGSVNGRNSYGGYVGAKRFYVSWKKTGESRPEVWIESTTESERDSSYESRVMDSLCNPSNLNAVTKVVDASAK